MQSKKAKFEQTTKEAFGPVTGIQELLCSSTDIQFVHKESSANVANNGIANTHNEIFGATTNSKKQMNTTMTSSPTTEILPISQIEIPMNKLSPNEILDKKENTQEALRHRIFAGSSLSKEHVIAMSSANNVAVKDKVTHLKNQSLTKELEDIVAVLNEESTRETNKKLTTQLHVDNITPSLDNSDLADQLHQLFKKDYQEYT